MLGSYEGAGGFYEVSERTPERMIFCVFYRDVSHLALKTSDFVEDGLGGFSRRWGLKNGAADDKGRSSVLQGGLRRRHPTLIVGF